MSDITNTERRTLEKALSMGSGYVLDFVDRTFDEFIADSVGLEVRDSRYAVNGTSKANRLRTVWKIEPNHVVGKLLEDLAAYSSQLSDGIRPAPDLIEEVRRAAARLRASAPVPELAAALPAGQDRTTNELVRLIREAITANRPESALDRLHTLLAHYLRSLCTKHGCPTAQDEPANSLVGRYVKALKAKGLLESEMAERILKYAIHTVEAFNHIRNQKSLAHPNTVLNYDESLLVVSHVSSVVQFIASVERRADAASQPASPITDDVIPF